MAYTQDEENRRTQQAIEESRLSHERNKRTIEEATQRHVDSLKSPSTGGGSGNGPGGGATSGCLLLIVTGVGLVAVALGLVKIMA